MGMYIFGNSDNKIKKNTPPRLIAVYKILPFILCTIITLFIYWFNAEQEMVIGDAGDYWLMGNALFENGFSLYKLPSAFRGYVFPLYLGIISKLFGGLTGFKMLNSLMIGILFGGILPKMFIAYGNEKQTVKSILCFTVFLFFCKGLVIYSLADLFALGMCTCSIMSCNYCSEEKPTWKNMISIFICGITCYLAYNVRTIYLFASMYIMIRLLILIYKTGKNKLIKILEAGVFCAGWILSAIPQLLINRHFDSSFSLFVPTSGLMRTQLFWGIQYQRYDTFVGGILKGQYLNEHPSPQMFFLDSVGQALIAKEGINGFPTWLDYIKFVLKYPIEVGGIYIRHLINILFPCWPNQYVYDLDNNKLFIAAGMLVITFLFLLIVCERMSLNNLVYRKNIPLLIPTIFILPGAVEVRYFVAFYIMIIYTLAFNTNWEKLLLYIKQHLCKTAILFVLYSGIICSMWSNFLVSETAYKIFIY